MNFNYFIDYLRLKVELDKDCEAALRARVKEILITRGCNLLYPGDLCKYIYFIKSGFFRVYTSDGYQDKTIDFATNDQFMTAIDGFFNQRISNEGITCEENAVVFRISYHDWLALEDFSPQFLNLSNKILQEYLLRINYQKNIYRVSNATKKYLHLCEQYLNIANVVSQKHIANYLGITAPTLSNLLKEMFRNPNKLI